MNPVEKMKITLDLAEEALLQGEMPISACVFMGDHVVARAYTSEKTEGRLLVHAELKALQQTDILRFTLSDRKKLQLFTSLEPCLMCYGAAMSFCLGEIYYSLKAPEDGASDLINFHNFNSDYLRFQKPFMLGGYELERSKFLFSRYSELTPAGPLYDFACQVLNTLKLPFPLCCINHMLGKYLNPFYFLAFIL